MKKLTIVLCVVAAVVLSACQNSAAPIQTKTYSFEDSTAHATFKMAAELPTGTDRVSTAIREKLMDLIDDQLGHIVSYEGERQFDAFAGDRSDTEAFLKYYFGKSLDILARDSDKDARDRELYMTEDPEMDDSERAEILSRMPGWEYEFGLTKEDDTPSYVVFESQDYVYLGGAHGGVTGAGCLTFDKKTGALVETFLDEDCVEDLQPVIREGLVGYFASDDGEVTEENLDDWLLLDDDLIPLPAWQPFPSKDGLVFTYQQYEIAPYAAGMPSFVIPIDKLEPYLTDEARALLR